MKYYPTQTQLAAVIPAGSTFELSSGVHGLERVCIQALSQTEAELVRPDTYWSSCGIRKYFLSQGNYTFLHVEGHVPHCTKPLSSQRVSTMASQKKPPSGKYFTRSNNVKTRSEI